MDSLARLSPTSRLAQSARVTPVWLMCTPAAPLAARELLQACGVEVIETPAAPDGQVDVTAVARELGRRGLTRVLVEGGGRLTASLMKADLADRVSVYTAGLALGGDSRPAVGDLGLKRLDFAPRLVLVSTQPVGGDTVARWRRAA